LLDFRSILEEVAGHETGWPPWWFPTREGIRPYAADGVIECWLAEPGADEAGGFALGDGAHSDLWRGDPGGRMFLFRGYQEDGGHARAQPGSQLDLTLPVWRSGECLLHVERLARRLGASRGLFMMRWDGLEGRELVAYGDRDVYPGRTCLQNTVASVVELDVTKITETLPEIVRSIVEPLYTVFDFFKPPDELYAEELARMRRRG
jgi:transcriptional regulator with XRE-family HTH domain